MRIHRGQPGDGEGVEVDAAEVGADPPRAPEPVRLGDVGEEGGVDDVDRDADLARGRAAVTTRGRVSELVDHRGAQQDPDDREQHRWVDEDGVDGAAQARLPEQPDVRGDETDQAEHDDRPVEQRREQAREEPRHHGGDEGAAEPQRQQRVRARQDADGWRGRDGGSGAWRLSLFRCRASVRWGRRGADRCGGSGGGPHGEPERAVLAVFDGGLGGDSHGPQLRRDEEPYSVGVERPPVLVADAGGDLLQAAVAVEVRRDDEEQARHVQHLLVGPHDQVVRLGEPGALVLAEERDPRRKGRRHESGVGHRRRVLRASSRWRRGAVCAEALTSAPRAEAEPSPDRLGLRLVRAQLRWVSSG